MGDKKGQGRKFPEQEGSSVLMTHWLRCLSCINPGRGLGDKVRFSLLSPNFKKEQPNKINKSVTRAGVAPNEDVYDPPFRSTVRHRPTTSSPHRRAPTASPQSHLHETGGEGLWWWQEEGGASWPAVLRLSGNDGERGSDAAAAGSGQPAGEQSSSKGAAVLVPSEETVASPGFQGD